MKGVRGERPNPPKDKNTFLLSYLMMKSQQFFIISFILSAIIAAVMMILITETADFLVKNGIGTIKAYAIAAIFELTAIFLIEYLSLSEPYKKWSQFVLKVICIIILTAIFIGIIAATGIKAASPSLSRSRFRSEDTQKLNALNDSVKSAEQALESVKGQPKNSAQASRTLQAAIESKSKFLASMKPDMILVSVNNTGAVIMIGIRILLQSLSWILSGILGSMVRANLELTKEPEAKPERSAVPVRTFVNPSKSEYKIESPTLGTEMICSPEQPKPVSAGVKLIQDCKAAIKPQEAVRKIYPEAKCLPEGLNGNKIFNIVIPSTGEVIGSAKNASLAWVDARRGLI